MQANHHAAGHEDSSDDKTSSVTANSTESPEADVLEAEEDVIEDTQEPGEEPSVQLRIAAPVELLLNKMVFRKALKSGASLQKVQKIYRPELEDHIKSFLLLVCQNADHVAPGVIAFLAQKKPESIFDRSYSSEDMPLNFLLRTAIRCGWPPKLREATKALLDVFVGQVMTTKVEQEDVQDHLEALLTWTCPNFPKELLQCVASSVKAWSCGGMPLRLTICHCPYTGVVDADSLILVQAILQSRLVESWGHSSRGDWPLSVYQDYWKSILRNGSLKACGIYQYENSPITITCEASGEKLSLAAAIGPVLQEITNAGESPCGIEEFTLGRCSLGDDFSLVGLVDMVLVMPRLRDLRIRIGDRPLDQVQHTADTLHQLLNVTQSLKFLDLNFKSLLPSMEDSLLPMFESLRHNTTLKKLHCSGMEHALECQKLMTNVLQNHNTTLEVVSFWEERQPLHLLPIPKSATRLSYYCLLNQVGRGLLRNPETRNPETLVGLIPTIGAHLPFPWKAMELGLLFGLLLDSLDVWVYVHCDQQQQQEPLPIENNYNNNIIMLLMDPAWNTGFFI